MSTKKDRTEEQLLRPPQAPKKETTAPLQAGLGRPLRYAPYQSPLSILQAFLPEHRHAMVVIKRPKW